MAFFTAENASVLGRIGGANGKGKPKHFPKKRKVASETDIQDSRAREVLELIQEQIEETRTMLNDKTSCYCEHCKRSGIDANARAKLLVGLDRLLERERVWSQRAGPGQLRPVQEGRRQARYWEKPVVMRPIDTTGGGQQPPALPGTTGSGQP